MLPKPYLSCLDSAIQCTYIDHCEHVGEGGVGDQEKDGTVDVHDTFLVIVQAEEDQAKNHSHNLDTELNHVLQACNVWNVNKKNKVSTNS